MDATQISTSTWVVAAIGVTFLVILGLIWLTPLSSNPRFDMTLRALSSLGVMVALLSFVFVDMQRAMERQKESIDSAVAVSQANAEQISAMFRDPDLHRLFCQMNSELQSARASPDCRLVSDRGPMTIAEMVAADRILSSIENIASYAAVQLPESTMEQVEEYWSTDPGFEGYLPLFRMWLKSRILREMWEESKQFYGEEMRVFMDNVVVAVV